MPGKWTDQAERDLIFAVLVSHTGGNLKAKVSWDTVMNQMHAWGHTDFTKEALNQYWRKTIVKDFKEGNGDVSFSASTPSKDTAAAGTPASRKRKTVTPRATPKSAAAINPEDEEEAGDEQDRKAVATPTPKKRKPSAKKTPKVEPESKMEEQPASLFGSGVKRETADEA